MPAAGDVPDLVASAAVPLERAGVIVRVDGRLAFLPTEAVVRFVTVPVLSDVSGTGLAMALVDGQVLAVVPIGMRGASLAVCELGGELIGLLGAHPEDAGFFQADGAGVFYGGKRAPALDLAELVRRAVLATNETEKAEA